MYMSESISFFSFYLVWKLTVEKARLIETFIYFWQGSPLWTIVLLLRQSITVFSLVRLVMWLLRTNQSTVLLWVRKCFQALGNTVFLLVRLVMWLLRTNQSTVLLWRRKCFQNLGNTVFLLVRLVMWLLRPNQSTVLLWRRSCFLSL